MGGASGHSSVTQRRPPPFAPWPGVRAGRGSRRRCGPSNQHTRAGSFPGRPPIVPGGGAAIRPFIRSLPSWAGNLSHATRSRARPRRRPAERRPPGSCRPRRTPRGPASTPHRPSWPIPRRDPMTLDTSNPTAAPSAPQDAPAAPAPTPSTSPAGDPVARLPGLPTVAIVDSRVIVAGAHDQTPVAVLAARPRRLLWHGEIVPDRPRGGRRERARLEAARARRAAELAERPSRKVGR